MPPNMPTTDRLIAPGDIAAAFGLLTRLPAGGGIGRGGASAWAWPLAGGAVAGLAALAGVAAAGIGLGAGVAAVLVLAVQALLTGAMHEDGLADTADGLWGGGDRTRRLEIMHDSRSGSYGVLALVLVVLARWSALAAVLAGPGWAALLGIVAVGALSRAPMAVLMAWLPNARGHGLAQGIGRPGAATAWLAVGIGFVAALVLTGPAAALGMAALVALTSAGLGLVARARIGGQTGDILGASQQLAEAAALAALAASLT